MGQGTSWERALTRRSFLYVGLAGAATFVLAACGGGGDGETQAGADTGAAAGGLTEPSTKPDKLVVRTWGDPWQSAYANGPGKAFTEQTGIPVEFDVTDYNEIQAKVQQAVDAGRRPPVDVVGTVEDAAYAATVRGLTVPLDPSVVTNFDLLNPVGRPESGSDYVNPYSYTQPIVFSVERAPLPAEVSWEVLWDPQYEGRVFVTSTSPASLLYPVAKMLGLDVATDDLTPAFDRIAELRPNIGGAGDEEEFIAGVERGEFDLGITLAAVAAEVEGLDWVVPTEGAVLSFESLYVPQGLPEDVTYWAQVFIDRVLDAQTLTTVAAALAEVPTNPQSSLADFMMNDPAFPFTEEEIAKYAIIVPPEVAVRNADAWQAAYTAAIQG